jgi:hypothetical protein
VPPATSSLSATASTAARVIADRAGRHLPGGARLHSTEVIELSTGIGRSLRGGTLAAASAFNRRPQDLPACPYSGEKI